MSLYINTNTPSVFAQRTLGGNTRALSKSIEKLSTGMRINRGSDDAAGLAISEKLTAQVRGLEKAEQNIGDGISLVDTAEAALSTVAENVQRIRELAVQAANGTNDTDELDNIQREINFIVGNINQIGAQTDFRGITLLQGGADVTLQVGADQGDTASLNISDLDIRAGQAAAAGNINFGLAATDELDEFHVGGTTGAGAIATVGGTTTANGDLDDLDQVINNVSRMRSELGAMRNYLESKADVVNKTKESMMASRSRVLDTDIAKESSNFVKQQILQQTAGAMVSQANATPQIALSLLP